MPEQDERALRDELAEEEAALETIAAMGLAGADPVAVAMARSIATERCDELREQLQSASRSEAV